MNRKILIIILILSLLLSACANQTVQGKEQEYAHAQDLWEQGNYEEAAVAFTALGTYKDSQYMLSEIRMAQDYEKAMALLDAKHYSQAFTALCELGDYKDAQQQLARFQIIEVTTGNWQEYFEISTEPVYSMSASGEYEHLDFYHYFRMKDDTYSRIYDFSRNTVNVFFSYVMILRNLHLDSQTGDYSMVADESYFVNLGHTRNGQVSMANADQAVLLGVSTHTQGFDGIGVPFSNIDEWENITVTEISGYLYLYQ